MHTFCMYDALRPGSTFIDGSSKVKPQMIAVEISYLVSYYIEKSIYKCGDRMQRRWRLVDSSRHIPLVTIARCDQICGQNKN